MNVSLTPELESYVNEKVESGMYASASEVVREGLRLLRDQEYVRSTRIAMLREEIQVGLDELGRGEWSPAEDVFARVRERLRARGKP